MLVLGLNLLHTNNICPLLPKPLKKTFARSRANTIQIGSNDPNHGCLSIDMAMGSVRKMREATRWILPHTLRKYAANSAS
jgi:hypothetical protein